MTVADPIAALRAQIDAVDDQILDLIGRRAAFAEALAVAKGEAGGALALRPAREVQVVRRLIERAPGPVDADLVVELWRALMSAGLRRQQQLEVAVAGAGDPVRLFDVARRHFGASARIARFEDPRAVLTRLLTEPQVVAVLPWPGGAGPGGWWPILNERRYHKLGILAALPMRAEAGGEPEAAVVAADGLLEPAGGDVTLCVAFDPHHRTARALNDAAIAGREIGRARETVLIACGEFLAAGDRRLPMLVGAGLDGFRIVGSYARV